MRMQIPTVNTKLIRYGAWSLPILYVLFFVIGLPVVNVSRGHTGIDMFYGKPVGVREAGWSFKLPLIEVLEISNQARNTTDKASESPTHDLQVANVDLNSSWSILPGRMLDLYTFFGDQDSIEQNLIRPGLQEVQKSISAKYDAYDLQQKAAVIAEESKTAMNNWVSESLKLRGLPNQIDVATVLFPHVEFSPEFKAATSEQTTTEQSVGTYENQRTKAITDAEASKAAKIRDAQAQAYKIKADADAETAGIIAKAAALKQNPKLLCYMVHKGWNGKLPEVTNGASPLPFPEVCKD
ncbi:MAG: hypothetical protein JSS86_19405 [Cyanobacteria bacterium SZAS LIN-2]|nr:hypothetical protein [Cyanobacteria bacterium SZAS LIN-2]MBS2007953.1 hypothetical protein [Cyanobacteria bacterium SZAS TMP-1]